MVIVATTDFGSILRQSRVSLGLPAEAAPLDDETLLAAATRRMAGILCPCPASTLANRLAESFLKLIREPQAELRQRFRDMIERLVMQGDLLELSSVTTVDEAARNSWIFAAPPSFLQRRSGAVFLLGITPDENSPLPATLATRVRHDGPLRILDPIDPDENLGAALRGHGLHAIAEEAWLKPPKEETAQEHLERLGRQLDLHGSVGAISGITVIDPNKASNSYRDRWVEPKAQNGRFVARRPQAYGADIWGFVTLEGGLAARFLDLPLRGARYRGCDAAWRLQAAIDSEQGKPQRFRVRQVGDGRAIVDLFGPVPMWVERRLRLVGRPVTPERAMISFSLPCAEVGGLEDFLGRYLWMSQQ